LDDAAVDVGGAAVVSGAGAVVTTVLTTVSLWPVTVLTCVFTRIGPAALPGSSRVTARAMPAPMSARTSAARAGTSQPGRACSTATAVRRVGAATGATI